MTLDCYGNPEAPRDGDTIETTARGKYTKGEDGRHYILSDAGERLHIPEACAIRVVERAPVDGPANDLPGTIRQRGERVYVLHAKGSGLAFRGEYPWISPETGIGYGHRGMRGTRVVGAVPGSPADKPAAPEGVTVYATTWGSSTRWAVQGSAAWRRSVTNTTSPWSPSDVSPVTLVQSSNTRVVEWNPAWPPLPEAPRSGRMAVEGPPLTFTNGYTVEQITQTAGALTVAEARRLVRDGAKITAIKLVREEVPGLGLREAKEFVETLVPLRKFERSEDIPADVRAVEDAAGWLAERTPGGSRWFYSRMSSHGPRYPYTRAAATFAAPPDDAPFVEVVE
jgi:hypothetical protein